MTTTTIINHQRLSNIRSDRPWFLLTVGFFCWIVCWQHVQCQSCGPRVSPRLLREIPCDMNTRSFCTEPGSAYPWSAVRRYIFDNQGFMKRMYGEHRQSQVIREEIHRLNNRYANLDLGVFREAKNDLFNEPTNRTVNQTSENESTDQIQNNTFADASVNQTNKNVEWALASGSGGTTESQSQPEVESTTVVDELVSPLNPQLTYIHSTELEPEIDTVPPETENAVPAEPNKPAKGYNACPVTQEVVAPYWANNTRGETLALLNVYPFEQYIHWEKCAFEGEQMLCREGCRCEQQYRLHRLLAFDPKNECRGIFADWFRFPGCCVCICYDSHERINNRKARL